MSKRQIGWQGAVSTVEHISSFDIAKIIGLGSHDSNQPLIFPRPFILGLSVLEHATNMPDVALVDALEKVLAGHAQDIIFLGDTQCDSVVVSLAQQYARKRGENPATPTFVWEVLNGPQVVAIISTWTTNNTLGSCTRLIDGRGDVELPECHSVASLKEKLPYDILAGGIAQDLSRCATQLAKMRDN